MKEQIQENKNEIRKPHKKLKILLCVFGIITIIATGFLLYCRYIGTSGLKVKEYKITNSKIPESMHGLKIVHISDIHYGRITFEKELKKLVNKINLTKPDIVILSGDLMDENTKLTGEMADQMSNTLKEINATIGKYAIKGNHDYKLKQWDFILENSGFIDLDNTYDTIYKGSNDYILISGISTNLHGKETVEEKMAATNQYLKSITEENKLPKYKILVLHEPDFIKEIDADSFDLILAGHSHNGQVRLPLIGALILPEGAKTYYEPYYRINNTDFYISSGIGVSTVNFRLFNRPSFNLYRLTTY